MYEPPSARMGVGKRQGEGGDYTLLSPRQISASPAKNAGVVHRVHHDHQTDERGQCRYARQGRDTGNPCRRGCGFLVPRLGLDTSILFRPRSCEGGRLADTTDIPPRWMEGKWTGWLGWLEFLPGLPARGALPRQDIPRWEGVCKCVLTTLATNVHPSTRRMICRWQSTGEGNGAIIVHLACPDLLSPQETRRRDVVNLRPIPPPPTSAGLGGSGWTKTKATLPRLGQVAGVRIAGDAEGGGVGSDGGGRGEGATRGEQPKAAAPKTPSADAASNRRLHRRAAARQTDTWAAADDTAQLRIGGRTGSDGRGTASDVDVSSSWWKGEIKTASSKRRPRSGSESWLLTSASMSQASGLGKIQSAKCHLWSRMEPRARGQSNPSARQNSSSELRKYSRRWDISKTPEIWDARGCAVMDASSKVIVFEPHRVASPRRRPSPCAPPAPRHRRPVRPVAAINLRLCKAQGKT